MGALKVAEFRVVESSVYRGKVSLRTLEPDQGLRDVLTVAGFGHGDQVVVVEKRAWERLCAEHVAAGERR